MLVGFSVSNFKSFNKAQSISFVASKVARHKSHIATVANRKILKTSLIYGANAGGKSNLIDAIEFSRNIILSGIEKTDLVNKHFRIDPHSYSVPGGFEYRLVANGVEYSYGIAISYENKEILGEWLSKIIDGGKEETIFSREVNDNGITEAVSEKVGANNLEKTKMDFYLSDFNGNVSTSLRKKTILADIAERINDDPNMFNEIRDVFAWFNDMVIIHPSSRYVGLNSLVSDNEVREFFSDIVSSFDTGIDSIAGRETTFDLDKVTQKMSHEEIENLKLDLSNIDEEHPRMLRTSRGFFLLHRNKDGEIAYTRMQLNHGNVDDLFDYADESDGTKRLFDFIPLFFESSRRSVLLIDEIDRSLHTNLTRRFLEMFFSLTEDQNNQLIATTHDSNLLDLDFIRQDEVWFVERQNDHSSTIFSLSKFKERFDKRIDKEYLLGRYGAIPIFKDIFSEVKSNGQ